MKKQLLLLKRFVSYFQVIIIQPQTPSSSEVSPSVQADLPSQEAPPTPKSPTKKKDEDPEVRDRHTILMSQKVVL